jgi:hypothetical protein
MDDFRILMTGMKLISPEWFWQYYMTLLVIFFNGKLSIIYNSENPRSITARDSYEYVPSNCCICGLKEITFRNVQKYRSNKTSWNTIYLFIIPSAICFGQYGHYQGVYKGRNKTCAVVYVWDLKTWTGLDWTGLDVLRIVQQHNRDELS